MMALSMKLGLVAYDDVSHSVDAYKLAFGKFLGNMNYSIEVAWPSIEDLISVINHDGVGLINELGKILVLDEGFKDKINTSKMVEDFVSLQESLDFAGVHSPELILMTKNQDLFDAFKRNETLNGHETFSYEKTRVFKLDTDMDDQISVKQIIDIVEGNLNDKALAIRKDYKDRGTIAHERLNDLKKDNNKDNDFDALVASLKTSKPSIRKKNDDLDKLSNDVPTQNMSDDNESKKKISIPDENLDTELPGKGHSNAKVIDKGDHRRESTFYDIEEISKLRKQIVGQQDPLNLNHKLGDTVGQLTIFGYKGSGISSVTWNIANLFFAMKKKVLIVNLLDFDDISKYSDFKDLYKQINYRYPMQTEFNHLRDVIVPIENNLYIYSNLEIEQMKEISNQQISRIKRSVNDYDIVLYMANSQRVIDLLDNNVLYVSRLDDINKLNAVRNENLSFMIINEIMYSIKNDDIYDKIMHLSVTNDRSNLVGTISHRNDWHLQYLSKIPIIFYDKTQMKNFEDMMKKVIL